MKRRDMLPNSQFEDKIEELGRKFVSLFKQKAVDTLPEIEDKLNQYEKDLEEKRNQRMAKM